MQSNKTIRPYYGVGQRSDVAKLIPKLNKNPKILEVGCGIGGFSRNFDNACEYWGVEPYSDAAAEAAKILYKVIPQKYDKALSELPVNYFDLIVLNDVIEHIDDTQWFLGSIKNLLSENGQIVGSIPNVRFSDNLYRMLILRDWRYSDCGILDRTHLRFFTRKSTIRMFAEAKFELVKFQGLGVTPLSFESGRDFVYKIGLKIIPLLFGEDAKYLQYGFLAKSADKIP